LLAHAAWFYLLQHAGIMCGLASCLAARWAPTNALCSRIAALPLPHRWMPLLPLHLESDAGLDGLFALSAMLSLACLHWHHWPGGRFMPPC
jgi:hypothetical protein